VWNQLRSELQGKFNSIGEFTLAEDDEDFGRKSPHLCAEMLRYHLIIDAFRQHLTDLLLAFR
jgi:hypothetical protein